ncbi:restriction endonuclease subunit S [Streptomyces sp. NPDC101117]|uniref:restriction endonuclease subunit S n=1 Tax=Streptomyces sp. NPDC101117 TaxID=3366108 RepID=UPI0038018C55
MSYFSPWDQVPLADVLDFQEGPGIMARDFRECGVPLIRIAGLKNQGRLLVGCDFLDEEMVLTRWNHFRLQAGDVLLSTSASLGEIAVVDQLCAGAIAYTGIIRFRPKDGRILREFIRHALCAPSFKRQIEAMGVGSVIKHFGPTHLRQMTVCLPPVRDQEAIAQVLDALDHKIVLNERIASTTRELARTVMAALWDRGGITSLARSDTAVPRDWVRTTLGSLCASGGGAIQTGPFGSQLHASDYVDSGIPSVMPQNIGDNVVSENGIARITPADAERLSKYLLSEGDIVYSRRGDVKRRALVRKYEAGWLCGTGCLRVRAGSAVNSLFLSYYLGEREIQDWIAQHAVGATMPNLNTAILGSVPVVLPPNEEMRRVSERLAGLDATTAHLQHENRTLADLRDTLLPQLLSGKLRVKDAVRTVEEVV